MTKNIDLGVAPIIKKDITSVLISQPEPKLGKSPYYALAEKYDIKVDFRQFIQVEGVEIREFRRNRINPLEYTGIILTSKLAIDHFFRICDELRIKMPQEMKYICTSEAVALYLQKFIQYRKRKVSFGDGSFAKMKDNLKKFKKEGERLLFPCSDVRKDEIPNYLQENDFKFSEVAIYRTVNSDLSDLQDIFYDVIVFYSPSGLRSLFYNFPGFQQKDTRIAAWGHATSQAVLDCGLRLDIVAPTHESKSMTMALNRHIEYIKNNKIKNNSGVSDILDLKE